MGKISSDCMVNEKINVHRWWENDCHSSCFCTLYIDQFFKTKKKKRFDQYLYIGLKGLEIPFSCNVTVERVQTLKGNVPIVFFSNFSLKISIFWEKYVVRRTSIRKKISSLECNRQSLIIILIYLLD